MDTIELADGGILLYHDAFLPPDLADRHFVELRDMSAWEQKKATFGHLQPRLTASYGDEGVTYFYSGTENKALPWTPMLLEMKFGIAHHPLGNPHTPGVTNSTEFPAGSRK